MYKKMFICPFDEAHVIEETKINKHILKCKSPNRENFEQCPFNQMHWILYKSM